MLAFSKTRNSTDNVEILAIHVALLLTITSNLYHAYMVSLICIDHFFIKS